MDLFYGATIPACVLVCNRSKPAERKGKILFIDISDGFERRDTKNVLTDDAISKAAAVYADGDEIASVSRFVSRDEIVSNNFNLTVRRYVRGDDENADGELDLDEAIDAVRTAAAKRAASMMKLDEVLNALSEAE